MNDTVIDGETGEVVSDEPKNYEIVEHDGKRCRYYPSTGAVMEVLPSGRMKIVANRGGRKNFDGAAMVAVRELKKEQAIVDGLEKASKVFDLRGPSEMLARIVAFRALVAATSADRTGNSDAKFVFSLVSQGSLDEEEQPALRIDLDKETAEKLMERLLEL